MLHMLLWLFLVLNGLNQMLSILHNMQYWVCHHLYSSRTHFRWKSINICIVVMDKLSPLRLKSRIYPCVHLFLLQMLPHTWCVLHFNINTLTFWKCILSFVQKKQKIKINIWNIYSKEINIICFSFPWRLSIAEKGRGQGWKWNKMLNKYVVRVHIWKAAFLTRKEQTHFQCVWSCLCSSSNNRLRF